MLKGYKYRLYPNKKQAELINKNIGACRFIYNLALETKNYAYQTHRKNISTYDLINQFSDLKEECEWLKEVDSQALQQAVINLDKAFSQFFKGCAKFPNFKKKSNNQSFRNPHGNKVTIKNGKLYQPKFKDGINIVVDRDFKGIIKSTSISKTPTGKYFVSVLVDNKKELPNKKIITKNTTIGIDLGIKSFIVTSNGLKINNPKPLKKALSHLVYLQRQVSKKKKGSQNKKKANLKVALQHEYISNQRKDFLHKPSTQLIKNHNTLCFEDLNISGMVKNHKLAQSISDAGWGMFVDFCKYKAEWNGKNILQIPTFEPSTKICSICGAKIETLTLADREWYCVNCGTLHDRDKNAADVIKNYCLNKINCGGLHREKSVELPTIVRTKKQKVINCQVI